MPPFDVNMYEEGKKRKIALRKWANLLPSAKTTLLEIIVSEATRGDLFKTCVTCNHFEVIEPTGGEGDTIERCKLVGKRPPAKIIADGCEHYSEGYMYDDDIPF